MIITELFRNSQALFSVPDGPFSCPLLLDQLAVFDRFIGIILWLMVLTDAWLVREQNVPAVNPLCSRRFAISVIED